MDLKPLRNGYEGKFSYTHFATIKVCKTKGSLVKTRDPGTGRAHEDPKGLCRNPSVLQRLGYCGCRKWMVNIETG